MARKVIVYAMVTAWTAPPSTALPAYCPNCGTIFPSHFRVRRSPFPNAFWGNKEQCPNCRSWAEVSERVFRFTNDAIEIISAPDFTREMLRFVEDIAKRAKSGDLSQTDAVEHVNTISPKLGQLLGVPGIW
jgi:ssDNA-binding Zn-finger/Zn-ribbon topoisomerase 1